MFKAENKHRSNSNTRGGHSSPVFKVVANSRDSHFDYDMENMKSDIKGIMIP